jgi:hypothetical protein
LLWRQSPFGARSSNALLVDNKAPWLTKSRITLFLYNMASSDGLPRRICKRELISSRKEDLNRDIAAPVRIDSAAFNIPVMFASKRLSVFLNTPAVRCTSHL